MAESNYEQLYKIVLIGDSGVGKSCLVSRYVKGVFPQSRGTTIGVEFASKNIALSNGTKVKAQIWDTAGQERYLAITAAHYRRAIGALVVYDIGKKSSFDHCEKWIQDVKEQADPDITIMLVGNKLDQAETKGREVSEQDGLSFAESQKILFTETSALDNTNVEDAFLDLLLKIDENRMKQMKKDKTPVGHHLGPSTTFGTLDEKSGDGCSC